MRTYDLKPFKCRAGDYVLLVPGSRIYKVGAQQATDLAEWQHSGGIGESLAPLCGALDGTGRTIPVLPPLPPVTSFSLNLAQLCNMRCGYCYADYGKFGGDASQMSVGTARLAIERLLERVPTGKTVQFGFMGGEPLIHRDLLRQTVLYAEECCRAAGCPVRFSLTTNGTLIRKSDAEFFSEHRFHVSVSIDGDAEDHDRFRILDSGVGTYASVQRALGHFRSAGWPRHLAGRCTLTPRSSRVIDIIDHLLSMGFDSAGVAPVLSSPHPDLAFEESQLDFLVEQMIETGRKAQCAMSLGRNYRFSNFTAALAEIHRGSSRFLPCGAAAGYLSVSSEGRLFACHRMIGDDRVAMGDLAAGIDNEARRRFLEPRHVDGFEPCRSCWARYLCGGGCHQEVMAAGRPACNYVRRWLEFCLCAYAELTAMRPDFPDMGGDPEPEAWRDS
jgi:uncharacterized protein